MKEQTNQPIDVALRELLREQDLTDNALAKITSLNHSTISRYLSRKRGRVLSQKTVETISRIAEALGKQPEYFLEVRVYHARIEIEQAMREGVLDLEDIRVLAQEARSHRSRGERATPV